VPSRGGVVTQAVGQLLGHRSFPRAQVAVQRDDPAVLVEPRRRPLAENVGQPAVPQAPRRARVHTCLEDDRERTLNAAWEEGGGGLFRQTSPPLYENVNSN